MSAQRAYRLFWCSGAPPSGCPPPSFPIVNPLPEKLQPMRLFDRPCLTPCTWLTSPCSTWSR